MGPVGLPEASYDGVEREGRQVAHGPHAQVVQPFGRSRAHAPQGLHVVPVQERELVRRLHQIHTAPGLETRAAGARLGGAGGQLGDHLGATDPDGTLEMELVVHAPTEAPGDVRRQPEQADRTADVHERLVQADRLDHGSDVGQHLVQRRV